ncbi:MAG TPA: YceI family protein [Gemmatimonadales bacterium]
MRSPSADRRTRAALGLAAAAVAWCGALSLAVRDLAAQAVPDARVASGTVGFEADATVGDFEGESSEVSGEVTGGPTPAAVRGWVAFPARSLRTGIGLRDRDMWKSLEADRHPEIRLEITRVAVEGVRGDTVLARVDGTLTVRGVARPVSSPVAAVRTADGFHVSGRFPIDLREWKIGGLRRMLGTLRVDPEVVVKFDLRLVGGGEM